MSLQLPKQWEKEEEPRPGAKRSLSHDGFADKLKCPFCGETFEDGPDGKKEIHTKNTTDQRAQEIEEDRAHFKYLEHFGENHSEKRFTGAEVLE